MNSHYSSGMMNETLLNQIESLRSKLNELANEHGLRHPLVLRKSKQLDKLIALYMDEV
ncbi:aspartyl-phosphate phosphatase Spo0E family protein [Bacillus solitudinis]|uniref:aspartyl-phosphate phosphatase Spo0E family protein n=1 Tax=Bacillus solitudinis TaxID=2014074 RepID=UPI001D0D479B|nr:aspartyl-phosphate phosphatase Spo0E family protein [Bacillus solitudinis]